MEAQQDYKELLELLNKHKADYVIVGAYALAFHGYPRYTGDLDILVKTDKPNAEKILSAIREFGFESLDISLNDFSSPGKVVQLGVPPVRIDVITSITGVGWERISPNRIKGEYGGVPVYFIGKSEFIANKKVIGRHKDLADVEAIEKENNT
ncbi:nucleotidyltransferase family protein [bacterium]|jgi:hypothetical protein|nr:nucleotidyltransferase family protein [bacterium]